MYVQPIIRQVLLSCIHSVLVQSTVPASLHAALCPSSQPCHLPALVVSRRIHRLSPLQVPSILLSFCCYYAARSSPSPLRPGASTFGSTWSVPSPDPNFVTSCPPHLFLVRFDFLRRCAHFVSAPASCARLRAVPSRLPPSGFSRRRIFNPSAASFAAAPLN